MHVGSHPHLLCSCADGRHLCTQIVAPPSDAALDVAAVAAEARALLDAHGLTVDGTTDAEQKDDDTATDERTWFSGGAGNDFIDGGSGFDQADYRNSASGATVTARPAVPPG